MFGNFGQVCTHMIYTIIYDIFGIFAKIRALFFNFYNVLRRLGMPEFTHKGKTYQNPVEFALDKIGGKWKMPILWRLKDRVWRYGELRKSLKSITPKMLTQQLRELEADGFIYRKVYPVVPPKVEYSITDAGVQTIPIIDTLRNWGLELMRKEGIAD